MRIFTTIKHEFIQCVHGAVQAKAENAGRKRVVVETVADEPTTPTVYKVCQKNTCEDFYIEV